MNDRGQLLIAGAFVLAVALIGLTLVFSAGNYTDTLASQEDSVAGGDDAITVRESVEANLADILAYVNSDSSPSEAKFSENLSWYANQTAAYHARNGRFVNVSQFPIPSSERTTDGYRVAQTTDSVFTSPVTGDNNWSLPNSPTQRILVRNLTFKFTDITRPNPTTPPPRFTIKFNVTDTDPLTDRNNWSVSVFDSGVDARIRVVEEDGYSSTCSRDETIAAGPSSEPLTVDLSEATFDGNHCPALQQLSPATPYNINITNGSYTEGKFWLITNETSTGTFSNFDVSSDHRRDPVLYDATARYSYHAPRVDYETNVTVGPGEIP